MKFQHYKIDMVGPGSRIGDARSWMVSLGYLDAYRRAWLPANLIQAQRDYFGEHIYERGDVKVTFHTEWVTK